VYTRLYTREAYHAIYTREAYWAIYTREAYWAIPQGVLCLSYPRVYYASHTTGCTPLMTVRVQGVHLS